MLGQFLLIIRRYAFFVLFLKAIEIFEVFAPKLDNNDRELFIKDLNLWKQHWDTFVRSDHGGTHKLSSFLSQIALGCTQPACQDGIALLTIHSAKGLEFDIVFIVGMAEGTFPDYRVKIRVPEFLLHFYLFFIAFVF